MSLDNGRDTLIILTPGFPESEFDCTCLPFIQSHIVAIEQQFPDLEVMVLAFQYPYFKSAYKWRNIDVLSFGGRGRAKVRRVMLWTRVWQQLQLLRKQKRIAGLLSLWCTECALVGHYFGKQYGLKHFIWLCGQDARKENRYVRLTRPEAGELIAMSDFLRSEFHRNHGINPAYTIPAGVASSSRDSGPPRDIDLLGVGSLIPLKRYDIFVDVVADLISTFPDIRSLICGKGPEDRVLEDRIGKCNLKRNVGLMGELPHDDIIGVMRRTKVFVHTSNYEGLGLVCLEALNEGAHVISFTRPIEKDISNWYHVDNKEQMVDKIRELLSDPKLAFEAITPFAVESAAKQIVALFN